MSLTGDQNNFIQEALSDVKLFKQKTKPYISAIADDDQKVGNFVITALQHVLKNRKKKNDATIFLNSLRLVKEVMDLRMDSILSKVQANILPLYQEYGRFKIKDKSDDRGRTFFSEKPDNEEMLKGNSCLRLILESIMSWPIMFPTDSYGNPTKFKAVHDGLLKEGVKFPSEINYFKKVAPPPPPPPPPPPLQNSQKPTDIDNKKSMLKSNINNKSSHIISSIEEKLSLNKGNKEFLISLLMVDNEKDVEFESLFMIAQNFEQFNSSAEKMINNLFTEDDPRKDAFMNQIFQDQEFGIDFIEDLKGYGEKKTISFAELREKYLKRLGATPEIATPAPQRNEDANQDIREAQNHHPEEEEVQPIEIASQSLHHSLHQSMHQSNHQSAKNEKSQSQIPSEHIINQYDSPQYNEELSPQLSKKESPKRVEVEEIIHIPKGGSLINHYEEKELPITQHVKDMPKLPNTQQVFAKSEFQPISNHNPPPSYGFKSEFSKNSAKSFKAIFANEDAFKLEQKSYISSKAVPLIRPEEKRNQIQTIKEVLERGWDDNNSDARSELEYDNKKEANRLMEENEALKEKILRLTSHHEENLRNVESLQRNYAEKEELSRRQLEELERERALKHNLEHMNKELTEKDEFIIRLQKDNDNLQLENEKLSNFIIEKQQENELLRMTMENQNNNENNNQVFETLNQLKQENDRLRNTIAEIQQNPVVLSSPNAQFPPHSPTQSQKIMMSKAAKPHRGPDDHENTIFGPLKERPTADLRTSLDVAKPLFNPNLKSQNSPLEKSFENSENRLSTYLKKSGKFSLHDSQKSDDQKLKPTKVNDGPKNFEENFDTHSVLNASLISVSQANLKFEASPYQADLIYPYTRPQDYYQGKTNVKPSKGRLVLYDKQLFDDIERNVKENILKFKMACIKAKSLLFDNGTLQVGLLSSVYRHNEKNLVKITIYFGNLTRYEMTEFKVVYSGNSSISLWTKPEILSAEIEAKQQTKQELLIDFNQLPFPFINIKCSYGQSGNFIKMLLPLPMTINKFLEPKTIEMSTFKFKWKADSGAIMKSEIFDLNPKICKSVYDFKKYFPHLIDLNPSKEYDYVSGIEDYKLAGAFDLDNEENEVLLKIVAKPDKKALFQVICLNKESLAEYLIRTLVFIFRK